MMRTHTHTRPHTRCWIHRLMLRFSLPSGFVCVSSFPRDPGVPAAMGGARALWILAVGSWISRGAEVVVEEGRDFVLECSWPGKNLTGDVFVWDQDGARRVFEYDAGLHSNNRNLGQDPRFCGRVSHFPGSLKDGNASVQVRAARISDSGNYTCSFPLGPSGRSRSIEVTVGVSQEPRQEDSGRADGPSAALLVSLLLNLVLLVLLVLVLLLLVRSKRLVHTCGGSGPTSGLRRRSDSEPMSEWSL